MVVWKAFYSRNKHLNIVWVLSRIKRRIGNVWKWATTILIERLELTWFPSQRLS